MELLYLEDFKWGYYGMLLCIFGIIFCLEESIFLFIYKHSFYIIFYKMGNIKLFNPLAFRTFMIVLTLVAFFVLFLDFNEFIAIKTTPEQMTFMYLKPRPYIEVNRYNIKSYKINHAKKYPNRQVIIELKDGRKIKSTYSGPESDFDKLIKELDKSIRNK